MNSFIICKLPKYCCVILMYVNNFLIIEEIYLTTISVASFMRYMNEWIWSSGGMILTGQSGTLCKRACSSATLLNIIPHKLAWDRTRTSALKISAYQPEPWHDYVYVIRIILFLSFKLNSKILAKDLGSIVR